MVAYHDFRDFLIDCAWRALQEWEMQDRVASQQNLAGAARLGDETSFLDVAGWTTEERQQRCLSGLFRWASSEEERQHVIEEGRRWDVKAIAAATARALTGIKQSLEDSWSPAKAGMLSRALPAIAASGFNPLAGRLGTALGVEADPVSLIRAYANAFCRNDRSALQAVDTAIIEDPLLGPLAVEMAGRLLNHIGAADLFDPASRDKVVSCLALLIDELLKRADRQETESAVSNG
jgi:hypothetical protein